METFLTAVYLTNRLPPSSKPSPWEQFFKKVLNYSQLKVFGCSCYPWLKPYTNSKLVAKSKLCAFIGYNLSHKCFKCLDLLTNRAYVSMHVYFDENTFPCHSITFCQTPHLSPSKNTLSTFSLTFPDLYPPTHSIISLPHHLTSLLLSPNLLLHINTQNHNHLHYLHIHMSLPYHLHHYNMSLLLTLCANQVQIRNLQT